MASRRLKRRWLLIGIGILCVGLVIELGGAIAWWIDTGKFFTWSRAAAARAAAESDRNPATNGRDAVHAAAAHGAIIHPFLGFVRDGIRDDFDEIEFSAYGFHGDRPPLRRRGVDRFIVGVVGGSVALHFGLYVEDLFATALKRSPTLAQREIEIVNLGLGGYKQPQQLMTIQLLLVLGGEFDCIINLDGFNEIALVNENVPRGVPAWFPRSWARLLDTVPTPEQQRRLGHLVVLRESRRERARSASSLWWSPLAQFIWQWRDRDLVGRIATLRAEAERAAVAPSPAVIGPGTGGLSVAEARVEMVDLWARASRQLHELCRQNGIEYFHFLQPNQYVPDSKPIGDEEAAVAVDLDHPWRTAVLEGYPRLVRAGAELSAAGVSFTDLTRIFTDNREPLYIDTCCHFSRQGHALVAEHIAATIRKRLDLEGVEWQRLIVRPSQFELTSPLKTDRLIVLGVDQFGREHDISGAAFGTRATSTPADRVDVLADGRVRAKRRGDATLVVAQGATVTEVSISATWPDLFEGDDGRAGEDGVVPRLLLDAAEVAGGSTSVAVTVSGVSGGRFQFVAVAPRPLPETPVGADPIGLHFVPIETKADMARVRVPVVARPGDPVFMRYYALDDNATGVVAASHTIVITRG